MSVSRPGPAIVAVLAAAALALVLTACGGGRAGPRTTLVTPPPPAPPAAPAPQLRADLMIGIGEQQQFMFDDPRFTVLGITHARLVIAYDAVSVGFERDLADAWMTGARRDGVEPFITFGHSRVHPAKLPSVSEFRAAFLAFRARYPDVTVYGPWNEINHASQPTDDAPRRAAEYYNVVRAHCPGCTVVAGDVLDQPGMIEYLTRYKRHLDGSPRIWALHNDADTNHFRDSGQRQLLAAVQGDIWMTETAGLVRFLPNFPPDEQRAARALQFALALADRTPRVKRLYVYNWTGTKPSQPFDAGLTAPDGRLRPAYGALRSMLGR